MFYTFRIKSYFLAAALLAGVFGAGALSWASPNLTPEERQQLKAFRRQHRQERLLIDKDQLAVANAGIGNYQSGLRDLKRELRQAKQQKDPQGVKQAKAYLKQYKQEFRPVYRQHLARHFYYRDVKKQVDKKNAARIKQPEDTVWKKVAPPLPKAVRRFIKDRRQELRQANQTDRKAIQQAKAAGDNLKAAQLRFAVKKRHQELNRVAKPQLLYARGYRLVPD